MRKTGEKRRKGVRRVEGGRGKAACDHVRPVSLLLTKVRASSLAAGRCADARQSNPRDDVLKFASAYFFFFRRATALFPGTRRCFRRLTRSAGSCLHAPPLREGGVGASVADKSQAGARNSQRLVTSAQRRTGHLASGRAAAPISRIDRDRPSPRSAGAALAPPHLPLQNAVAPPCLLDLPQYINTPSGTTRFFCFPSSHPSTHSASPSQHSSKGPLWPITTRLRLCLFSPISIATEQPILALSLLLIDRVFFSDVIP